MLSQLSTLDACRLMLVACCLSLAAPASAVSLEAAKKRKDQCSGARTKLIWHIPLTLFTHWSRTRPLRGPGNALSLPIWIATYSRSNNTKAERLRDQGPSVVWARLPLSFLARWSQLHWVGQCAIAFTVINGSGISSSCVSKQVTQPEVVP